MEILADVEIAKYPKEILDTLEQHDVEYERYELISFGLRQNFDITELVTVDYDDCLNLLDYATKQIDFHNVEYNGDKIDADVYQNGNLLYNISMSRKLYRELTTLRNTVFKNW